MNARRALLLVIAIGGLCMLWAASRYARQVDARRTDVAETTAGGDAGKMTVRFFRNPAAAPTFMARDLDGHEVSTASLRGKVVLINFWATWCPPCRAEIPDLVALQEKYKDRLQIIGVSEDEVSPEVVKRFAADHKMNYPTVMTSPDSAATYAIRSITWSAEWPLRVNTTFTPSTVSSEFIRAVE